MKEAIKIFFLLYSLTADAFLFSGCGTYPSSGLFGTSTYSVAPSYPQQSYYSGYPQYYYCYPQPVQQASAQATTQAIAANSAVAAAPTAAAAAGAPATAGSSAPTATAESPEAAAAAGAIAAGAATAASAQAQQPGPAPNEFPAPVESPPESSANPSPTGQEPAARSYGYGSIYGQAGRFNQPNWQHQRNSLPYQEPAPIDSGNLLPRPQLSRLQYPGRNAPLYQEAFQSQSANLHRPEPNAAFYPEPSPKSPLGLRSQLSSSQYLEHNTPYYPTATASKLDLHSRLSNLQQVESSAPSYHEQIVRYSLPSQSNWKYTESSVLPTLGGVQSTKPNLINQHPVSNWQQYQPPSASRLVTILPQVETIEHHRTDVPWQISERPAVMNSASSRTNLMGLRTLVPHAPLSPLSQNHLYENHVNPETHLINADSEYPYDYNSPASKFSSPSYDYLAYDELTDADEDSSPLMESYQDGY